MNKIIRFYNQNRRIIWISIFSIIIIIMLFNAFKDISIKNNKLREEQYNNYINTPKESDYKENPDISVTISDDEVENEKELIIDQFIRYCNAQNIEAAYNLLSDDCKKEIYPNINYFINNYLNAVFNSNKLYSKEFYSGNTYKIKLYEDVLSTGNLSGSTIEDYYTIEKTNEITKLNISNYIGYKEINQKNKNNKIEINVVSKSIYKEYEIYTIEVQNLSSSDIILDSMENTKNIYLTGNENVKYYCMLYEKTEEDLIIPANAKKVVTLKFDKSFTSNNIQAGSIVFSDIIYNKKEYELNTNKSEYTNRGKISINIK